MRGSGSSDTLRHRRAPPEARGDGDGDIDGSRDAARDGATPANRSRMSNQESFEGLYIRYAGLVLRLVTRWTKTPIDAEDIAQNVWAQVARAWPLPPLDNPAAYLTEVAKNEAKGFWRKQHSKKRKGEHVAIQEEDSFTPMDDRLARAGDDLGAKVDDRRSSERLRQLSEELSDCSGDAMRRLMTAPETVTPAERRRCVASARRKVESVKVNGLHEGPSHLGHVLNKLKEKK